MHLPCCLVCLSLLTSHHPAATVELEFLPNEYLVAGSDAAGGRPLLVKSYTFEQGTGSDRLLQSKVVAAPAWASTAKDPTHKSGRDGKQRPASSIFQLFKAGGGKYAFNLAGASKDVQVRVGVFLGGGWQEAAGGGSAGMQKQFARKTLCHGSIVGSLVRPCFSSHVCLGVVLVAATINALLSPCHTHSPSPLNTQEEANELETELLQELHSHLLLQAGQVYKQRQADGWHDEDTPAEDQRAWDAAAEAEADSDLGSEDDEDSDAEAEAAHAAAVRRSKQRKSWKPTKSEILIILVGMMLLGELFVFLDMAGLFNRGGRR